MKMHLLSVLIVTVALLSACTTSRDESIIAQEESSSSFSVSSSAISSAEVATWKEFRSAVPGLAFRYPDEAYVIEDSMDGPFPKMKLKVIEDPSNKRVFLTQEFLTFVNKTTQSSEQKLANLETLEQRKLSPESEVWHTSVLSFHLVDISSETALVALIKSLCTNPEQGQVPNFAQYRQDKDGIMFVTIPSGYYSNDGNVCANEIDGLSVKYFPSQGKAVWWHTGQVPKFRRNQSMIRIGERPSNVFDTEIAQSIELK